MSDLNQTYLDARKGLVDAQLGLPEGSAESDAIGSLIDKLDAEQITLSQKKFREGSASLSALASDLGDVIASLDANVVSSAIAKANEALGKINTLAEKAANLAS